MISDTLEVETRWAPGLSSRGILEAVNTVKYMLTKAPIDPMSRMIYDSMATFGDVQVFRHKFALPLGYAHERVMSLSDFKKCSPVQKDFLSLKTAVVEDEDLKKLSSLAPCKLSDTLPPNGFTLDTIAAWHAQRNQHTFQLSRFKPAHFAGKIVMPSDGMVYFSIPYDDGWLIREQGKELDKFLLSHGMIGVYLKAGEHALEFDFRQISADRGKKLSWAGLALFGFLIFLSVKTKKDAAI
ncbi:MAG: YfhO family protein [Bacteroidetes bacterium]|nr:YfhO family protein [Bacteroidota bacterium]